MNTSLQQRLAGITVALFLLLMALPALSVPKYLFAGYVQGRYTDTFGELPSGAEVPETFDIKRAYTLVNATVDEHISAMVMANWIPNVVLLEAYGEYKTAPYAARLGLSRIPFGYENPNSSAKLITTERSQASMKLIYPHTFDRGVFGYYQPAKGVNVAAGLTNGTPVNVVPVGTGFPAEANTNKTVIARVGYPVTGGQVGVSIYNGNNPTTNLKMDRLGADLQTKVGNVVILSEVIAGTDVLVAAGPDVDSLGGYVTLACRKAGSASEPYVRVDYFDPNRDASSDVFKRATVGYSYYFAPGTKIQAEAEVIDDELQPDLDGRATVQYQVSF